MEPTEPTETATMDPDASETDSPGAEPIEALVEDELLVEEISIDGMCGVY